MCMNLYRHIDRKKIQFDFLVYHQEHGDYEEEIESLGGAVYRIPDIKKLPAHIKGAKDFFANHKEYVAIHNHMQSSGGFICREAHKAGFRMIIYHSHSGPLPIIANNPKWTIRRIRNILVDKIALKNSNYFIACGEDSAIAIPQKYHPVTILRNAIDLDLFRYDPKTRQRIRKADKCENTLVIGNVARIDQNKNQIFALEVFKKLLSKHSNSELWLIGDGELKPEIEERIKKYSLMNKVRLLGIRTDVNELLQAMDVFLFPSISEGLPVSCIEAQAAGLQCVFSDGFDPHTIVTPNCRVLSLSEEPDTWADIILEIYKKDRTDTSDIIRMAGYDIKQTAKFMESYYLSKVRD